MFWKKRRQLDATEIDTAANEVGQFVLDVLKYGSNKSVSDGPYINWLFLPGPSYWTAKSVLTLSCAEEMALMLKKEHGRKSFDDGKFVAHCLNLVILGYLHSLRMLDDQTFTDMFHDGITIYDAGIDMKDDGSPAPGASELLLAVMHNDMLAYDNLRKRKPYRNCVGACAGAFRETLERRRNRLAAKQEALDTAATCLSLFEDEIGRIFA